MSGSSISTTLAHGVTLGTGAYVSPLTITAAGNIVPSAAGATALYETTSAGYVLNQGGITGGGGGAGASAAGTGGAGGTGGTGGTGVGLAAGGLTNRGTITGGSGGAGGAGGVGLVGPGGSGGFGGTGGIGVVGSGGSLVNFGTITGGRYGAAGAGGFGGGGQGPNGLPGLGGVGVRLPTGGTLTNAGFIGGGIGLGGYANAVEFGTGFSRLIVAPGASFRGTVAANAAYGNVLELTSAASAGTLSGAGSQFTGFASVTIDAGASWTLVSSALGAASTITDSGTLSNPGGLSGVGITVTTGGSLINPGTITGNAGGAGAAGSRGVDLAGGMITNDGTVAGGAGGFSSGLGGGGGVAIGAGAAGGSLVNIGRISGGAAGNGLNGGGAGGIAVDLAGDSLTNAAGARITGGVGGNAGDGFHSGNGGIGIDVAGGTVTNAAGATIAGGAGGLVAGSTGTGGNGGNGIHLASGSLINSGTITGGASGTFLTGGNSGTGGSGVAVVSGSLTNLAGASISGGGGATGGVGVRFQSGGTLTNAGFIGGGGAAHAVDFGLGTARLILSPGGALSGGAVANAAYGSLLELAAGTGTITGLGSGITGFGTIQIDPGAAWLVKGDGVGLANGQVINGFSADDTIELTGFVATGLTYVGSGLVLTSAGGSDLIGIQGSFASGDFTVTNNGTDSFITLQTACYREGTLIRTERGEVPVELLKAGDRVVSAFGGLVPVRWIGHRALDCRRHPRPWDVMPVRVLAGAFGAGLPRRDLWLSPDHAVFVDGVLIPIRHLLNGATVIQETVPAVRYFHVELPSHDVILAEGLPAESYLDTGNRSAFANGGAAMALHPDFALGVWQAEACARLVQDGAELKAARRALRARAEAMGHARTREARLRVIADGRDMRAEIDGDALRFRLPLEARRVRLLSRSAVPAEHDDDSADHRRLGVAVGRVAIDGIPVALGDPRLGGGWHDAEADWRWTDGDAGLAVAGGGLLEIAVAMTGTYWREAPEAAAMAV